MKTKHLLLATLLLFISLSQRAQNGLNNLSFETWTTTTLGPSPAGWYGFNVTQQTSGAQHENSYLRLSNGGMNQGVVMLGTMASFTNTGKGGAPCTQNPISLTGFFKTAGMASADTVGITAFTSASGSLSSLATFLQRSNVATWTSFSMPFVSVSPGSPDSIFIYATSGKPFNGNPNSTGLTFDLDNLTLNITITGIDQRSIGTAFMVYPNPASDALNIISRDETAATVVITGLDGKLIEEISMDANNTRIDLVNYPAGLYFYSILNQEHNVLLTNKFVVNK